MIKQLHVISSMDPTSGGPAQVIRYLLPHFDKNKTTADVVCLDKKDDFAFENSNINTIPLGKSVGPWQHNKNLYPWLMKNLAGYNLVVIHGLWLYNSFAVIRVLRKIKKDNLKSLPKVYIMPHGMLDPWFQTTFRRKLKSIRNWIYWKLIEESVVRNADGLLFTCEEEMNRAKLTFSPFRPKKLFNIGLGIQPPPIFSTSMNEAFYNVCPHLKGQGFLLFLSRIDPKKGLHLLLHAYKELLYEVSSIYQLPLLVVAGPGLESTYGIQLRNFVSSDVKLRDSVLFTGMLTGDEKWGAINACDAFVLPSHQENFGIAVVEAMACKKAVLISNKINIWCEIQEGSGGIISEDSKSGIKDSIKNWLNLSNAEKIIMGENAYITYKQNFIMSETANKILKLILV